MLTSAIAIAALALASLIWVEVVRDGYHALAHIWQPLYRLHVWHHRVFRPDLTPASEAIYRKAQWYHDVPESLVMLAFSPLPGIIAWNWQAPYQWASWTGSFYAFSFLASAIARGAGVPYADALTDLTHRPGDFKSLPAPWFVNRAYHWRHHFDNQDAYYSGTLTLVDKLLGTALSLKGKRIAVTGASGTLGRSLLKHLHQRGAKVIALTSQPQEVQIMVGGEALPIQTHTWKIGQESELFDLFASVDILIVNHGVNVGGQRTPQAIDHSYEVNTFSGWRLMELFFISVRSNEDKVRKEVWINTSEAEANPALSPLYELSKRALGDLITLRRLDSPCVVRKLILGPFKSDLNPYGVMSADWVAKQIVNLAQRDLRNIIVTVNPLTFITFPLKEFSTSLYFKLFSRRTKPVEGYVIGK
jgi:hypothetical protein